jgi:outer membrane protein
MQEEEQVLYRRVFDALNSYLVKMNQEKGFAMIISTNSATNTILLGDSGLDITKMVVAGLNDEYIKTKAKR